VTICKADCLSIHLLKKAILLTTGVVFATVLEICFSKFRFQLIVITRAFRSDLDLIPCESVTLIGLDLLKITSSDFVLLLIMPMSSRYFFDRCYSVVKFLTIVKYA